MTILRTILERKNVEVASLKLTPCSTASVKRSLATAIQSRHTALIAEIKPVSPTSGRLLELKDVPRMVGICNRHAQAISVLCDKATFGGGFDLLESVRAQTDLPLLAKDFIVDARQIDAAAFFGADAVLLIAAILTDDLLRRFIARSIGLGMDALIELHDIEEVEPVIRLVKSLPERDQAHILLGINNRDLETQHIDLKTTERLSTALRRSLPDRVLISESGIGHASDIRRLAPHVQGFLVGSAILESKDPDTFLSSLLPKP
jgi:indole-3-glycerol phosphate synthase